MSKPRTHLVIPDTQAKPGVPTDHLGWIGEYILDRRAGLPYLTQILGKGTASTAEAQPATDAQCTSMAMPSGQGAPSPNSLTRAGQIGAATGAGGAQSMPADCTPASHG